MKIQGKECGREVFYAYLLRRMGTPPCHGTCEVVREQLAAVDTLLPITPFFESPLNFYETGFDEDKMRELNTMLTVTLAFISPV